MKYVMFQTSAGRKLPFIFPEGLTHLFVAVAAAKAIELCTKEKATAVSAGFITLGLGAEVHGESESMGGLASVPADAARIMVGESIAFMPDELAEDMLIRLKEMATSGALPSGSD